MEVLNMNRVVVALTMLGAAAAQTTPKPPADPLICEVGGGGLLLPLGGDGEQEWPKPLRIVLYLLGLLWCFIGVGIVSDVFMGAIEAVTSKKKRVKVKGTNRYVTVKVWNDTVANLTLMALGSSAPEILLSVIELLGNEFYSGALGPSTIVGSAAFNLFCISAVCIAAIPSDSIRYIKDTAVFSITASFSVFAYVWLVVILMLSSPDVVEIWEGLLTFLFFPVLVTLAYLADIGTFSGKTREEVVSSRVTAAEMSKEELAEMIMKVRQQYGSNLTDEQAISVIEKETAQPKSRAEYRVAASRAMTGGKKIAIDNKNDAKYTIQKAEGTGDDQTDLAKKNQMVIEFKNMKYAVLESSPSVTLQVVRTGDTSKLAVVEYKSKDGTANAGQDYEAVEGKLEFKAGETMQEIQVKIIDDTAYELDEDFYVELSNPWCNETGAIASDKVILGAQNVATITIIDDDEPGTLFFQKETETITEKPEDFTFTAVVERKNGSKGKVECKYYTENDSAISPNDYEHSEGTMVLDEGQMSACIEVTIKARGRYDGTESFRIYIAEPTGGAKFEQTTDGGADTCIMTVFITADEKNKHKVDGIQKVLNMNWDKVRVGHASYAEQFTSALWPNGSPEDAKEASAGDVFTHILAVPWKLLFALIPPPDYGDGWVCFCVALVFIGGVTAIIGDMAALLGCTMDVPDSITAITFVALGTSLPDTFASKTAATQDEYADASIGNVTGSNSVNVFLGLGLPWSIGAIVWKLRGASDEWKMKYAGETVVADYPDGGFVVIAGDLGFSVIVFTLCAITTILVLEIRRKVVGGELGGADPLRKGSSAFLVCLWFTYVGLSSWKTLDTLSKSKE
jgi:solute carrier family 8 (sodium/calcium exchanger)